MNKKLEINIETNIWNGNRWQRCYGTRFTQLDIYTMHEALQNAEMLIFWKS